MKHRKPGKLLRISLMAALLQLNACSLGSRQPIPPGVVPPGRAVSTAEEQYGHEVLNKLSEKWELDYDHPRFTEITRIVDRLTAAAKADAQPWHIYLFKAPGVINAAATRGNHIFVWSGMLDFATTEEELATVLAHEIAHVLAGHTDPDPKEAIRHLLVGVGAAAAGIAVASAAGGTAGQITSALTQEVGSGFLVNPFSREREAEADHIGLFLMADAKYDPSGAIAFWSRAEKNPSFNSSLEFFSTHPLAHDRLSTLQQYLPEASDRYRGIIRPPLKLSPSDEFARRSGSKEPDKRDSFSLNDSPEPAAASRWEIKSAKAVLYSRPSVKSRRIGEFSKGARIDAREAQAGWVEIFSPDHGYLRESDLRKR